VSVRPRLTEDEYDLIIEMRKAAGTYQNPAAIKAAAAHYKRGFEARHSITPEESKDQREQGEAWDPRKGTSNESYGAVPGIDGEMEIGDLRDDVVCEVTSNLTGIISDAHWPFHDLRRDASGQFYGAYLTALQELKNAGVQTVILNGDMMDCYQLSSHEKIELKRSWKWELDVGKKMLEHLRKFFGDGVRIIYREGNHEERFQRYLARKASELQGTIDIESMLGIRDNGIEWVCNRAKMTIGKLWVDHGHEWYGGGGVMPARNFRMKALDNILVGHVHRTSQDQIRRPLDGSFIAGWSVGCLCDLNPHYAPRNGWNHGFATVQLEGDGTFAVNNRTIINGVVR
jgi:metallophosphoesterase superfamily enzyme